MLLGARYYDPLIGRFITQDPAKDGLNWYAYADGNPVNMGDPEGAGAKEVIAWPFVKLGQGIHWVASGIWNGAKRVLGVSGGKNKDALGLRKASKANADLQKEFPEYARRQQFVGEDIGRTTREVTDEAAVQAIAAAMTIAIGEYANARAANTANVANKLKLVKQLAMKEARTIEGEAMAGAGCTRGIGDIARLVRQYGGQAADWQKMKGPAHYLTDGTNVQVHWYRNMRTGWGYEYKLKIQRTR